MKRRTPPPVRVLTAAALFDGHDAAINVIRRVLQGCGAEVIHLGHNRSVEEIARAAVEEDVAAVAISSYQGGHMEFFRYLVATLRGLGAGDIKVFGGGGGVIVPTEARRLERLGVTRIYTPEDGTRLGLKGIVEHMLGICRQAQRRLPQRLPENLGIGNRLALGRLVSVLEAGPAPLRARLRKSLAQRLKEKRPAPVVAFTGPGGAGKSSLVDELLLRLLQLFPELRVGVVSVDPTLPGVGGALLGDRIRLNTAGNDRVFVRSLATRQRHVSLSIATRDALDLLRAAAFDLVLLETAGIGQADARARDLADLAVYVMTPEFGAPSQLEKIAMLGCADLIALNKFDRPGALDALREVRRAVQRARGRFADKAEDMPVYGTCAQRCADPGVNSFCNALLARVREVAPHPENFAAALLTEGAPDTDPLIPPLRRHHLAEVAAAVRGHKQRARAEAEIARRAGGLYAALVAAGDTPPELPEFYGTAALAGGAVPGLLELRRAYNKALEELGAEGARLIVAHAELATAYAGPQNTYTVRGREIKVENQAHTLSGLAIARVAVPALADWGARILYQRLENAPGRFPYTAGVYEYKREEEEPTRMFAGEGGPERTNARFHFICRGGKTARLSTAFDSVTLYGHDPDIRPDIYGKIGNSGVSVCSLDDMKRLYSGFDLAAPQTSVSMTINGPAPMLLAWFLTTAVDAAVERRIKVAGRLAHTRQRVAAWFRARAAVPPRYRGPLPEGHDGSGLLFLGVPARIIVEPQLYNEVRREVLSSVRGTVQADILKEDQAQNTCIFSTEFALRLMGDVQQWFLDHGVRNFYSVSISGYHIAEAGANPVSQLAFTLANAFTYAEVYRQRGMDFNRFAPNFSFFFSNGTDAEYAVLARVARRIWALAARALYGADERSAKLKCHIQTSGRSLHSQEMQFNDTRTTLQALYAIADNCNSLHTNAYDEAVTTPTEESVRRAIAIQLIVLRELGLTQNQNPLQGSHFIEQLTDLVEEAVLREFEALDARGGALGAMETHYQRSRIQEESLAYEQKKMNGELPIVGVNTFLPVGGTGVPRHVELRRSSAAEKRAQIAEVRRLRQLFAPERAAALAQLTRAARAGGNVFAELMDACPYGTLGDLAAALHGAGGSYRRNM